MPSEPGGWGKPRDYAPAVPGGGWRATATAGPASWGNPAAAAPATEEFAAEASPAQDPAAEAEAAAVAASNYDRATPTHGVGACGTAAAATTASED